MLLAILSRVVLFIMLYKVNKSRKNHFCDHSNESYWAYFPVVLFIMLYQVVVNEVESVE